MCSIESIDLEWFRLIEARYPGSLLNNCSYELWEKRYISGHYAQEGDEQQRQVLKLARPGPPAMTPHERHLSEWCLRVQLLKGSDHEARVFGVGRRLPLPNIQTSIESAHFVENCVIIARCKCALDVELVSRLTLQNAKVARSQWPLPTTTIMVTL